MSTNSDRGAQRAARAIVELINARPFSPRCDEIEAIIRHAVKEDEGPPTSPPTADPLDEYGPDLTISTP